MRWENSGGIAVESTHRVTVVVLRASSWYWRFLRILLFPVRLIFALGITIPSKIPTTRAQDFPTRKRSSIFLHDNSALLSARMRYFPIGIARVDDFSNFRDMTGAWIHAVNLWRREPLIINKRDYRGARVSVIANLFKRKCTATVIAALIPPALIDYSLIAFPVGLVKIYRFSGYLNAISSDFSFSQLIRSRLLSANHTRPAIS